MNDSRKKMLERIKAMLNTEGRTEAEMMAFLAKARELMATYEIDEKDIAEFDCESASTYKSSEQDPYDIKFKIGYAVGKFCRCEAWREKNGQRMFCGMESDIIFATWLLNTLQRFVMRALRQYQKDLIKKGAFHSNNLTSTSFVVGCVGRIIEKLNELTPKYETNAIVTAEMAKKGIVLRKSSIRHGELNERSANAGAEAGGRARFDRPVEAGGVRYLK